MIMKPKWWRGFSISPELVKCPHKQTAICNATTKKAIQRDMLKNVKDKSKWKTKKYSSEAHEGRKRETKPKTKRTTENK